jgi:hypothetical protein
MNLTEILFGKKPSPPPPPPVTQDDFNAVLRRVEKLERDYNTILVGQLSNLLSSREEQFSKGWETTGIIQKPVTSTAPPLKRLCEHLKGGVLRSPGSKDYALSKHTFIDNSQRIKCLLGCGYEVWKNKTGTPDNPEEWERASKMLESSTNKPSSSERSFPMNTPTVEPSEAYMHMKGPVADFRKDETWMDAALRLKKYQEARSEKSLFVTRKAKSPEQQVEVACIQDNLHTKRKKVVPKKKVTK